MCSKQGIRDEENNEVLRALATNASAVQVVAQAVEGTLGPKGLDTMLVDQLGNVVVTNDGITILDLMQVSHPAARMMVNIARSQQMEVGDGTTTATLMAASIVEAGYRQLVQGVPVSRIIAGIKVGIEAGLEFFKKHSRPIKNIEDKELFATALVAGRGDKEIAELVLKAVQLVGVEKLIEPHSSLAETITAQVGTDSKVFPGIMINRERMSIQMPKKVNNASILIIDDALEPEELQEEALHTEMGFQRYLEVQEEFHNNLAKLVELGIKVILVDRRVSPQAEEFLAEAGLMVVQSVPQRELRKAAEYTQARFVKRTGLKKSAEELALCLGWAEAVYEDEKLEQIFILGGKGKSLATVLVGAATAEVVSELERIARDAASAVQAAIKGGVVPGGGSIELACARHLEGLRSQLSGMEVYGLDCVMEGLKRPFFQIIANAGYSPLEKLGDVLALKQGETGFLAIDCDTGEIRDMNEMGVLDPTLVKIHALKAAGEVAMAILRIATIVRMKEQGVGEPSLII